MLCLGGLAAGARNMLAANQLVHQPDIANCVGAGNPMNGWPMRQEVISGNYNRTRFQAANSGLMVDFTNPGHANAAVVAHVPQWYDPTPGVQQLVNIVAHANCAHFQTNTAIIIRDLRPHMNPNNNYLYPGHAVHTCSYVWTVGPAGNKRLYCSCPDFAKGGDPFKPGSTFARCPCRHCDSIRACGALRPDPRAQVCKHIMCVICHHNNGGHFTTMNATGQLP